MRKKRIGKYESSDKYIGEEEELANVNYHSGSKTIEIEESETYECEECEKEFDSEEALNGHKASHAED